MELWQGVIHLSAPGNPAKHHATPRENFLDAPLISTQNWTVDIGLHHLYWNSFRKQSLIGQDEHKE